MVILQRVTGIELEWNSWDSIGDVEKPLANTTHWFWIGSGKASSEQPDPQSPQPSDVCNTFTIL